MATVQDIQKQAIATGDFSSKAMTDAYLAAGGTLTNGKIPSKVAVAGQDIRPISVEDLMTSRTPIVIPESPLPSTAGAALAAGKARADSFQAPDLTQSEFEQQYGSVFKQGEELLGQTAEEAVAERNRASQEAANRRAAVARAQSELTNIQSQIQGFETQAKEEERALLRNAEGGLVTSAIFSRQRSKIQSQLAERVLPFQAQILAKQAEIQQLGGDAQAAEQLLADAKNQINTLFQLKMKDNENYRNFKLDMYNKAWDYATEGQKQQLQARRDSEARNQQTLNDAINDAQAWASKIFDTNPALASQIQRPDFGIDDPQFESKLAEYNRKVAEVVGQAEVRETFAPGDIGDFQRIYGRIPTEAELNAFTSRRVEAKRKEEIGGGRFTQTQLNEGAANAAVDAGTFNQLDPEIQNYFISLSPTQARDLQTTFAQIQNGEMKKEEVLEYIKSRRTVPVVEEFLTDLVNQLQSEEESSKGFFSRVWSGIVSLFQ